MVEQLHHFLFQHNKFPRQLKKDRMSTASSDSVGRYVMGSCRGSGSWQLGTVSEMDVDGKYFVIAHDGYIDDDIPSERINLLSSDFGNLEHFLCSNWTHL